MKSPLTSQKLRGGYYTPPLLADFLARWAVQRAGDAVLEPSCGDGAILEAVVRRREFFAADAERGVIIGIEIDPAEARKAELRLSQNSNHAQAQIVTADFFRYCRDVLLAEGLWEVLAPRFDAVIGNPPFIRYQSFPEKHRDIAFGLMRKAGLHPNKLTNAWVAFLVCAAMALKPNGRLGMVIPAELLQVNYAAEVRRFLSDYFERITLITFRNLVFPDIQQEVILLLAERTAGESQGIRTVELGQAADLDHFNFFESLNGELKPLDHNTEKWTKYFLPSRHILLLRRLRSSNLVSCVRDVAEVDVGMVTGENDFFILKPSAARALQVGRTTKRTISKSAQLRGLIFSRNDWKQLRDEDSPILLFAPRKASLQDLPRAARAYIRAGEARNQHIGYKCRLRSPWYVVPATWIPDAFALRQVHRFPKLVLNDAGATTTDTVHRVRFKHGVDPREVAAAFLNSMTFAFAEVMGRSYGGGVLTFEPSEVEGLPIPLRGSGQLDVDYIDDALRRGDIVSVLDHTDRVLLKENLGLGDRDIRDLRGIWDRLRDRRINRRSKSPQITLPALTEEPEGSLVLLGSFDLDLH